MRISDEGLKEFIAICKEDYGLDIPEGEARVCAVRLLLFYEMIYRPLPSELQSKQPSTDAPGPGQGVP